MGHLARYLEELVGSTPTQITTTVVPTTVGRAFLKLRKRKIMSTSVQTISRWFDEGVRNKHAEFMIVVTDTFDWDDYPVYTTAGKFSDNYHRHNGPNMQKVTEVYDLSKDKQAQLNQKRAFNYPEGWLK